MYYSQEAITNIIKHSGATTLTISTYEEEKYFMVEVTDNGCGIPENNIKGRGAGKYEKVYSKYKY